MKLVIEFNLDNELDITSNFHSLFEYFVEALQESVPNAKNKSFSAMYENAPKGEYDEIVLVEVKGAPVGETVDGESPVAARAMVLPEKMNVETLYSVSAAKGTRETVRIVPISIRERTKDGMLVAEADGEERELSFESDDLLTDALQFLKDNLRERPH